jgi:hypothetical protein
MVAVAACGDRAACLDAVSLPGLTRQSIPLDGPDARMTTIDSIKSERAGKISVLIDVMARSVLRAIRLCRVRVVRNGAKH